MLIVDGEPLSAPVVFDQIPAELRLIEFSYNPPDKGYRSRATLYGDPSLVDTLDGPVLLVGSSDGSAVIGGPPVGAPGERRVDLGDHKEGWLVHVGDRAWVGIEQTDSQDYVQFVVGRGISDEQLIRAATSADFSTDTATLAPDAVPAGLEALIAGEPPDGPYLYGGEMLRWRGDPYINVYLHAVRADPRLAALWGFWADDSGGTMVRGQPGSVGDMPGIGLLEDARGRVWAEDGMVLSVVASGASEELIDRVVAGLRVGTDAEIEAIRAGLLEREPTAEDAGCTPGALVVSAIEGDFRWAFGLDPDAAFSCTALISAAQPPTGVSGSFELVPLGQVSATTGGFGGGPDDISYTIVGGVAPPGTARVVIAGPGGMTLDAVLTATGPRPGERLFGQLFQEVGYGPQSGINFRITAFDASGATVATFAL